MLSSPLHRATALGQLLALLIAITASTSTVLARLGLSFPTLQLVLNYSLLAVAYGYLHFGRNKNRGLSRPAWHYALLAVLDVEANFLVVTSFRFTSVTSVTFLDAWSIPVALMLTRLLALATYKRGHYVGAALCVLGLGLLVVTDKHGPQGEATAWSSNALLGDVLVVLGATLYGAGNVLQEHLLGDVDAAELLCMLGVFGSIFSAIQGLPLELPGVLAAQWTPAAVLPFVGFGLAMFSFYSLVPYQLSWGGATMLNLSLLSSDLWTALARLLFFGGFSLWSGASFLVSFALLAAGIAVYSMHGDAKRPEGDAESHALPVAYARVGSTEAPHYGGLTVDEEGPGGRPHLQTLAGAREKLVPLRPPGRMMYEATELSSSL